MSINYNFSDAVWNGYQSLITNGSVKLNSYNELQAVATMMNDFGRGVIWNSKTGTLVLSNEN